jgi:hypothetical protein
MHLVRPSRQYMRLSVHADGLGCVCVMRATGSSVTRGLRARGVMRWQRRQVPEEGSEKRNTDKTKERLILMHWAEAQLVVGRVFVTVEVVVM